MSCTRLPSHLEANDTYQMFLMQGHGTWHFDRYIRDGTPVPEFV